MFLLGFRRVLCACSPRQALDSAHCYHSHGHAERALVTSVPQEAPATNSALNPAKQSCGIQVFLCCPQAQLVPMHRLRAADLHLAWMLTRTASAKTRPSCLLLSSSTARAAQTGGRPCSSTSSTRAACAASLEPSSPCPRHCQWGQVILDKAMALTGHLDQAALWMSTSPIISENSTYVLCVPTPRERLFWTDHSIQKSVVVPSARIMHGKWVMQGLTSFPRRGWCAGSPRRPHESSPLAAAAPSRALAS